MLSICLPHLGNAVDVTVDYPGYISGSALSAAGTRYVESLLESMQRAKDYAAADLLSTYNDNWREAAKPELTQAEFTEKLQLTTLRVLDEPGAASAIFTDGDMFGGHAVVVDFEGSDPSYVTLFG